MFVMFWLYYGGLLRQMSHQQKLQELIQVEFHGTHTLCALSTVTIGCIPLAICRSALQLHFRPINRMLGVAGFTVPLDRRPSRTAYPRKNVPLDSLSYRIEGPPNDHLGTLTEFVIVPLNKAWQRDL